MIDTLTIPPSAIVGGIVLFAAFILLELNKSRMQTRERELRVLVERLSKLIDRYNRALDGFNVIYNDRIKAIRAYNDSDAADEIIDIANTYEENRDEAYNIIERINNGNIQKANIKVVRESLDKCEKNIDAMESSIAFVKDIKPKEHTYRQSHRIEDERQYAPAATQAPTSYFAGCETKEQLEKRYRSLVKIYHPDSGAGDEESFKQIKAEYDYKKQRVG